MTEESRVKWRSSMEKYYSDPEYIERITSHLNHEGFKKWLENDSQEVGDWKQKISANLIEINKSRNSRMKRAIKKGGKAFYCVETGEKFFLLQDAADKFGTDKRNIHNVLTYPMRHKTIFRKYTFKYVD
jgi:hypothetical protein